MSVTVAIKKLIRAGIFVFLFAPPCEALIASGGSPCSVSAEETEVYADFLKFTSSHGSTQVVVGRTELRAGIDVDFSNLKLATRGEGIPSQVREDFKRKNQVQCSLNRLHIGGVKLISEAEADNSNLFQNKEKDFDKRYPRNTGLIFVSRVGFKSDGTIALLHVSMAGHRFGSGFLYVLRRVNDRWVVKTSIATWFF